MTDRVETENLLRQMYAARLRGDLDGVCDSFQPDATFQISGASFGTPMVMSANGIDQFRPLLAIMVKTLPHSDQKILSLLIDGACGGPLAGQDLFQDHRHQRRDRAHGHDRDP